MRISDWSSDVCSSDLKVRADTVRRNGMAGTADTVARSSLSPATRRGNPAAVAFVRESLLRQDPVGYAAHCEALAEAQPADHAAIACPTLLVTGDRKSTRLNSSH